MQIKDKGALTFLDKLKGDPNKRPRDKYCYFHQDHGNDIADCYDLKQQIEALIRQGRLPRFIDNPSIEFLEEDARRLHHPHDDALVVTIQAGDYNMHRVLIDNGSSADILYYPAFQQMGIERERLVPTNAPLIGFGGTRVFPLGVVTLAVAVGDYPQQITKSIAFLVVDCSSAYNAIIGRPTLNSWKAVTLTYHLMIKFPTNYGVGELRGDKVAVRECYVAMMKMDDHHQTMSIEEHQT
ncbi:uncharacterized protein LOC142615965 [Castanea sativa]|uniref:uncharacterized protein LOC142615965 n=1 Tax=Castanea sativa TaxID=21020 RepID=UPI003F649F29